MRTRNRSRAKDVVHSSERPKDKHARYMERPSVRMIDPRRS